MGQDRTDYDIDTGGYEVMQLVMTMIGDEKRIE